MPQKNSFIRLEDEDYKNIEKLIKGFAERYSVSGVSKVNIELKKEGGIVTFKKSDDIGVGQTEAPLSILKEALTECARGALLLNDYLSTTDDPEVRQLYDTIGYVIKSKKDSFM